MKTYVLALDLKDNPELISEYENYHKIIMHLNTSDEFSFENKSTMDDANPKVLEWESLMWKYQQAIPGFPANEKWQLCEEIFRLSDNL